MRILVTISRDWDDYAAIEDALCAAANDSHLSYPKITVVHGASQMDWFVAGVAYMLEMDTEAHPADWVTYGKAAGPKRNEKMVRKGADLCLAFIKNGSRGASHCAQMAEKGGIPVRRYTA